MNSKLALGWCGFVTLGFCLPAVAANESDEDRVQRRIIQLRRQAENREVNLKIRDLFTMQVPRAEPPTSPLPPGPPQPPVTKPHTPPPLPQPLKVVRAHHRKAYANLLARDFAGAFQQAERGLQEIDKGAFGADPERKVVAIENGLHRIRAAAKRLGHRERAEKGFADLVLQVQALIHSETQRLLLVNGNVMREGDRVRGAHVVDIGPRSAVFLYEGIRIRMPLRLEASSKQGRVQE